MHVQRWEECLADITDSVPRRAQGTLRGDDSQSLLGLYSLEPLGLSVIMCGEPGEEFWLQPVWSPALPLPPASCVTEASCSLSACPRFFQENGDNISIRVR